MGQSPDAIETRFLYPEQAVPVGADDRPYGEPALDQPMLTVHLPDPAIATGTGMLIAPGGGYRTLASDHEGLLVAQWLNSHGIAGFVLRYRPAPGYHSSTSINDGRRAIRYLRYHAKEFSISPQRVGFIGFSAGGHLGLALSVEPSSGIPDALDPLERLAGRPAFVVAGYPVTNGAVRGKKAAEYTPVDTRVAPDTPPTFLLHTHNDSVVTAAQSTLHYNALLQAGVPAELHIFNFGDHGLGLMEGDRDVATWKTLCIHWLRRHGLLTDKPRTAVNGTLTIEGKAPGLAWISLLPDDPDAPLARARIDRASGGKYLISEHTGPVSGNYSIEVHHCSEQHPPARDGRFSIAEARVFRRQTKIEATPGRAFELSLVLTDDDFSN